MRYVPPSSPRGRYADPTCASQTKAVESSHQPLRRHHPESDPEKAIKKDRPRWKYYVPVTSCVKSASSILGIDPSRSNVAVRQLQEEHRYIRKPSRDTPVPLTPGQQLAMSYAQRYETGLTDQLRRMPKRNERMQELSGEGDVTQIKALLSGRYTPVVDVKADVVHYPTLNKMYVHDASHEVRKKAEPALAKGTAKVQVKGCFVQKK